MERLRRTLRLARLRNDRLAIAVLEGRMAHDRMNMMYPPRDVRRSAYVGGDDFAQWTETEMRAMWGDR